MAEQNYEIRMIGLGVKGRGDELTALLQGRLPESPDPNFYGVIYEP